MNRSASAVLDQRRPLPHDQYLTGDKIDVFVRKEATVIPSLVFTVRGRLDYYNVASFQSFLRAHWGQGPLWVILDLAGMVHLSSSGINALVELADEVALLPGEFSVVSVPPAIRQWMTLLGLDERLAVYPALKDALEDLSQPQRHRRFRPLFPTTVACPSCGRSLKAEREGKFRCSSCKMPFAIDDRARVTLV